MLFFLLLIIPLNKKGIQYIFIKKLYFISLLIPQSICYYLLIFTSRGDGISYIMLPHYWAPLFITFLFLVYDIKYKLIYILLFFAIPIGAIAREKIITDNFIATCESKTPKAEYNPIYLPDEFFHEEIIDGKRILEPNIKDSTEIKNNKLFTKTENSTMDNDTAKYIYWTCGVFKKGIFDKKEDMERLYETFTLLTNNKHIILCKDYENSTYITKQVISPNEMEVITKKYELDIFTGIKGIIPGTSIKCQYHNNKKKIDYENFIKPLSEKPETLGE
ncbi:MAG: hypothetical protein ACK5N8_03330 [Alphaproteobacteria bacterium]